jgi:hypothetical protein
MPQGKFIAYPEVTFQTQGEENLGMAMTFTLVSHLREQLSSLVRIRAKKAANAETEKERLALEVFNIDLWLFSYLMSS